MGHDPRGHHADAAAVGRCRNLPTAAQPCRLHKRRECADIHKARKVVATCALGLAHANWIWERR